MPTAKRKRARVNVGVDGAGRPVYKWASAHTKKDLQAEIARILTENKALSAPPAAAAPTIAADLASPSVVQPVRTFRDYASEWYSLFKAPNIRIKTREMYENVLNTHLYPAFGAASITDITKGDVQRFVVRYAESSSSLIDKIMLVLRQVFDAAVEDDLIRKSPVAKVKPPEGTAAERVPLTLEQVEQVTRAAVRHSDGLLLLVLLYTGLRRGEALGLQWDDIRGGCIHVERAVVYEHNKTAVVGETKTDAAKREIPVMPMLADKLQACRSTGYVFGGSKPLPYTTFKRKWAALVRDIPGMEGVTPHRLRHTYLMLLRRAGVDPATQQYLMGHSEYETTANDYTHVDAVDRAEAGQKMAAKLPELLPVLLPQENVNIR